MEKVTKKTSCKSYYGGQGRDMCPNVYRVIVKTGILSDELRYYCTAQRQYIDAGYVSQVCKRNTHQTCSRFNGHIYPCTL